MLVSQEPPSPRQLAPSAVDNAIADRSQMEDRLRLVLVLQNGERVMIGSAAARNAIISIGRSSSSDVVLAGDKAVSKRHAEVSLIDYREVCVRDAGSSRGTQLNGRPLQTLDDADGKSAWTPISAGDQIGIGASILRVEALQAQRPTTVGPSSSRSPRGRSKDIPEFTQKKKPKVEEPAPAPVPVVEPEPAAEIAAEEPEEEEEDDDDEDGDDDDDEDESEEESDDDDDAPAWWDTWDGGGGGGDDDDGGDALLGKLSGNLLSALSGKKTESRAAGLTDWVPPARAGLDNSAPLLKF